MEELNVIFEISVLVILVLILLSNICVFFRLKSNERQDIDNQNFIRATFILNTVIDNVKDDYQKSILVVKKKYAVLQNDGSTKLPNDSITQYRSIKEKIKSKYAKKIVGSLTKYSRDIFLKYYTDRGFIEYIFSQLDKD